MENLNNIPTFTDDVLGKVAVEVSQEPGIPSQNTLWNVQW